MKSIITCTLFILISFFVSTSSANTDDSVHLKIGLYERTLFREKNAQGEWHGLDVDIVKATMDNTSFTYEFIDLPWQRSLRFLENGTIDILLSAAPLEDRKAYAYFSSNPFRLGHNALYIDNQKKASFANVHSLADLQGTNLRLGVLRGASYSDGYENLLQQEWFRQHLVVIDDRDRLPDMLMLNRIDAYLESAYDGQRRILLDPKASERISRYQLVTTHEEATTYMMFSKKSVSPAVVNQIDAALAHIVENGTYARLLADYQLEDVEKE